MPAPEKIKQLVITFEQNLKAYQTRKNETELRREFLDPFFEALGWDVSNTKGLDERRKEVAHEFSVEIDGQQKKADYAFRTGTRTTANEFDFLAEAKKPSEKIESTPKHAFQIKRYGWSAKLPINILTDFEHFAVYDCRIKPKYEDKVTAGRIKLYHYKEYIEKWDEIAALFSPDAVREGALSKYAEEVKVKRGTADVDDDFLAEIERWRELLAKNIANRNKDKQLTESQLNYAVQMTIDRIVFLRIAEERGMEEYRRLDSLSDPHRPSGTSPKSAGEKTLKPKGSADAARGEDGRGSEGSIYSQLKKLFIKADERYNSGLFHFKNSKKTLKVSKNIPIDNRDETFRVSHPDTLTFALDIDDKVLRDIIENLYEPKSPYAFAYIPADILGSIYERFLGKVIRLTPSGQAKVEDKPEVRKAGGVYYTPTYIVEYIVKNTVGKLVEGKTPKEVADIKVVDPACGSGSFLLGAYQYLLNWHLDWYVQNDPEKYVKNKTLLTQDNKTYRLSMDEKKRILLNNIHGVDLDPQAVEVTKLSLLLKVIEDPGQLQMFEEGHILPDLGNNIKCGNSLIGMDYFDGQLMTDAEEVKRVNPFDWKSAFPAVFDPLPASPKSAGQKTLKSNSIADLGEVPERSEWRRGFDAVIGNPPYIRIQAMQEWASEQLEFYKKIYKAASRGGYDIYVVFIEKALSLLNNKGLLGFILPHKFFNAQYGEPIRGVIANGKHLAKVVHFGAQQVFDDATTYTCLLFLDKAGQDEFDFEKVQDLNGWRITSTPEVSIVGKVNASRVTQNEWNFSVGEGAGLFEKLSSFSPKLGDVADIFVGLQTSADDLFIMDFVSEDTNTICLYSKLLKQNWFFEKDLVFPIVSGTDVNRYLPLPSRQYILFPYKVNEENAELIDFKSISKDQPKTAEYLIQNKKLLEDREGGKFKGQGWHRFGRNQNIGIQERIKLCVPRLVDRLYAGFDFEGKHYLDNVDVGGITLKPAYVEQKLMYLLGLLNCRLLRWYFPSISAPFRGGWLSANRQFLSQLPIRTINFSDPAEKAKHDSMVTLVERMLALHKNIASAKTPQEKESTQRQIQSTDAAIDKLVYELYGLTEDEVKIVEG